MRLRQQQNLVNRRGAKIDLGMSRKRPNHQSTHGNAALNLLGSVPKLIRSGKLIGSGAKRVELNVGDSARGDAPLAEAANALKPLPKGRNAVVKKSAVDEPASPSRVPSLFLSDKQDPVPTPKKNSFGPSRRWSQHDDGDLADLTLEEEPAHATDAVESSMTEAVTSNYSFNMFTAYLCDSISPTNDVSVLLDGEDAENDITQIVGRINDAANLPCGGCVISGEKGMIVSGRGAKTFEQLIVVHCSVMARRIFVSSFFHRLFDMESEIDAIQYSIQNHIGKPSGLAEIRRRVMEACKQASLLDSLLTQAKATSHDLPDIDASMVEAAEGKPSYRLMLETLQTREYREELMLRLKDLESLLKCARLGLDSLRENTDVISEMQMFKLQESLQSNTRNLESLFRSNESASSSLQIMQLVIGGSLAFSMMDRVTGEWTVVDTPWGNAFYETYIEPPGVWFCLSLLAFTIIVTGLHFTMKLMLRQASADMNVRYSLHVRVNIAKMRTLLNERRLYSEEADTDVEGNNMYKVAWEEPGEKFGGTPLRVEISVDQGHERLCTLNLKYNRREGRMSLPEVQDRFLRMLVDGGVIVDRDELGDLIRSNRAAMRGRRSARGTAREIARARRREDAPKLGPTSREHHVRLSNVAINKVSIRRVVYSSANRRLNSRDGASVGGARGGGFLLESAHFRLHHASLVLLLARRREPTPEARAHLVSVKREHHLSSFGATRLASLRAVAFSAAIAVFRLASRGDRRREEEEGGAVGALRLLLRLLLRLRHRLVLLHHLELLELLKLLKLQKLLQRRRRRAGRRRGERRRHPGRERRRHPGRERRRHPGRERRRHFGWRRVRRRAHSGSDAGEVRHRRVPLVRVAFLFGFGIRLLFGILLRRPFGFLLALRRGRRLAAVVRQRSRGSRGSRVPEHVRRAVEQGGSGRRRHVPLRPSRLGLSVEHQRRRE